MQHFGVGRVTFQVINADKNLFFKLTKYKEYISPTTCSSSRRAKFLNFEKRLKRASKARNDLLDV